MKLPAKVEKDLLSRGYIYKHREYWRKKGKLFQYIRPEKDSKGFSFYVNLRYPISEEDSLAIAPPVLDGVHANGYICGDFGADDHDSYLDPKDTDRMIEFLNTHVENHLDRLMDAELMIRVYQYLRGKASNDKGITEVFPVLSECHQREAPVNLEGIAAYLNLLGRFEEAKEYVLLYKENISRPSTIDKILRDAEDKKIQYFDVFAEAASDKKRRFENMEMSKNVCVVFIAKKRTRTNGDEFLTQTLAFKKTETDNWLVYAADINQVLEHEEKLTEKLSPLSKNTKLFMWLTQNVTGALWFEYHENGELKRKWFEIEGEVQSNIGAPLPEEVKGMFTSEEDEDGERDEREVIKVAEKITGINWETLTNL
jgi:hypothetical protein